MTRLGEAKRRTKDKVEASGKDQGECLTTCSILLSFPFVLDHQTVSFLFLCVLRMSFVCHAWNAVDVLHGAPVFRWPVPKPTVRSAMKVSSSLDLSFGTPNFALCFFVSFLFLSR